MIISVHQPQYIPWLGYFDKIANSDAFVFLDQVQYKEREFQNRNKIRTDRDGLWLTVPVISKGLGRQRISDVLIDNEIDWRKQHLLSLKNYYGRAGYFKDHLQFLEGLYGRQWGKLSELNVYIIDYLLDELAIKTPVYFESKLDITQAKTDRVIEICRKMNADTYLSGMGGKEYLEEEKFAKAGIKLAYQDFKHPVYRQQFMKEKGDFLPLMSALDLLFNEGPNSRSILNIGGRKA
jgi:hypothetical protein